MIRVCYSMLLLMVLSACANEQAQPAMNAQQVNTPSSGQNILACTGLPVAGQECGLKLPKMVLAPG